MIVKNCLKHLSFFKTSILLSLVIFSMHFSCLRKIIALKLETISENVCRQKKALVKIEFVCFRFDHMQTERKNVKRN